MCGNHFIHQFFNVPHLQIIPIHAVLEIGLKPPRIPKNVVLKDDAVMTIRWIAKSIPHAGTSRIMCGRKWKSSIKVYRKFNVCLSITVAERQTVRDEGRAGTKCAKKNRPHWHAAPLARQGLFMHLTCEKCILPREVLRFPSVLFILAVTGWPKA